MQCGIILIIKKIFLQVFYKIELIMHLTNLWNHYFYLNVSRETFNRNIIIC